MIYKEWTESIFNRLQKKLQYKGMDVRVYKEDLRHSDVTFAILIEGVMKFSFTVSNMEFKMNTPIQRKKLIRARIGDLAVEIRQFIKPIISVANRLGGK